MGSNPTLSAKYDLAVQFSKAKERFIQELVARNLHWTTFNKYKLMMRKLEEFAIDRDLKLLQHFDVPTLRDFTATWKDGLCEEQEDRTSPFLL